MLSQPTGLAHPALLEVPSRLWAKSKHDVVLIKNCEPFRITPRSDYRPYQKQCPLKPEAIEGTSPALNSFLESYIVVPCEDSPVSSPIYPVKKDVEPPEWRFIHDLQAVSAAIVAHAPNVPNTNTILSQVPPTAKETSSGNDNILSTRSAMDFRDRQGFC